MKARPSQPQTLHFVPEPYSRFSKGPFFADWRFHHQQPRRRRIESGMRNRMWKEIGHKEARKDTKKAGSRKIACLSGFLQDLDPQPLDVAEVPGVFCHERQGKRDRHRGDPQVVLTDRPVSGGIL